jgi:hypothetical protein
MVLSLALLGIGLPPAAAWEDTSLDRHRYDAMAELADDLAETAHDVFLDLLEDLQLNRRDFRLKTAIVGSSYAAMREGHGRLSEAAAKWIGQNLRAVANPGSKIQGSVFFRAPGDPVCIAVFTLERMAPRPAPKKIRTRPIEAPGHRF